MRSNHRGFTGCGCVGSGVSLPFLISSAGQEPFPRGFHPEVQGCADLN